MERTNYTERNSFGLPNIVIPAEVLFHPDLTSREKILFGFINNLAYSEQGCWASNKYLGGLIGVRPDTTSTAIAKLAELEFIFLEYQTRHSDGMTVRKIHTNKEYPVLYAEMLQEKMEEISKPKIQTKIGRPKKPSDKIQKGVWQNPKGDMVNPKRGIGFGQNNIDNKLDKDIDNKYLSRDLKAPESENEKNKPSAKERNKDFLPLAKELSEIICTQKNMKHTSSQINSWANEIRILIESNGVTRERVQAALDWYRDNIGGEYIPVIESGHSLRSKFIRLEDAMKREKKEKPAKHTKSNGKKPPAKIIQENIEPPKTLNKEFAADRLYRKGYKPAKSLLNDSNNGYSADLAQNIVETYNHIEHSQEKAMKRDPSAGGFLPPALDLIEDYIEWVEENNWISDRSPNLFTHQHALFKKFIDQVAAPRINDRCPLTGIDK